MGRVRHPRDDRPRRHHGADLGDRPLYPGDGSSGARGDLAEAVPRRLLELWRWPHPLRGDQRLDIALWDIKGKATNQPVYKLLGGKVNPRIKAYASQIQLGWGPVDHPIVAPAEYAQEAKRAIADGYTAVKVDPLWTDDKGLCTNPQRIYRTDNSSWEWKKLAPSTS